jgi:hypothetical protein
MAGVMECRANTAPRHMKIALYHQKRLEEGHTMQLQLSYMKVVFMPRLRLLTQLDPDGLYEFNVRIDQTPCRRV